ncbi:MAG: transcription-repair coupling factor [Pseudomonadota bacterium]
MSLSKGSNAFATISDLLAISQNGKVNCTGISGSAAAYCLSEMLLRTQRTLFVIVPSDKDMETLTSDILFFLKGRDELILKFPAYETTPFTRVDYPSATVAERISTLYKLISEEIPRIIVTTVEGLLLRVIPRNKLAAIPEIIIAGEEIDRDILVNRLIESGYKRTTIVEDPGEFSVRGDILDLFTPLATDPIRVEFYGDTVESIRYFSPDDQRSLKQLNEAIILPASEVIISTNDISGIVQRFKSMANQLDAPLSRLGPILNQVKNKEQFPGINGFLPLFYSKLDTIFDYLPQNVISVFLDMNACNDQMTLLKDMNQERYLSVKEKYPFTLPPDTLYADADKIMLLLLTCKGSVMFHEFLEDEPQQQTHSTQPATEDIQSFPKHCRFAVDRNESIKEKLKAFMRRDAILAPLVEWLMECRTKGYNPTIVCSGQKGMERMNGLLSQYGIDVGIEPHRTVRLCNGELSAGFLWKEESIAIITDQEIFRSESLRKKAASRPVSSETQLLSFQSLREGDLIVHIEHGIGRYLGLINLTVNGHADDFILIQYDGNDKLYMPVDALQNIQKYLGVDGVEPRLDKLGGKNWEKVKEKVKESIRETAKDLLDLYAWRKAQAGFTFSQAEEIFEDFEAQFEHEETSDQSRAINEVLADMESSSPMDRLVCGDVGYGKTEVAIRAAFKAVCDSKQVAMLVPTTVLLEQHLETFKKRLVRYPVKVAGLSRFRPITEQKQILADTAEGKIDILIGTHRLLQKDTQFKDLGLIIIDEEQRFGVKHKEALKKMRRTVDVLALTATPIPRTLHMSMLGIRDLSTIMTPPEHRHSIKTHVCRFEESTIVDAITRELSRKGQVFFVHNNIKSIDAMARYIKKLVPQARIGVAHGRLDERELEKAMLQFFKKEIDLLVCTTIIESGLDVSSANTIMINRADRFGLAQMYQLRGRVGRGTDQAYAYLFIPGHDALTKNAQKRLRVLMEHDQLGAGFHIALNDLQIRGGGAILGTSQSGHVAAVGYEMYLQLIEQAVQDLKGEPIPREVEPEIIVDVSAFIPDSYVADIDQRLSLYKRLSRVSSLNDLDILYNEIVDRYGRLPEEAQGLKDKVALKISSRKLRINRLEAKKKELIFGFDKEHCADLQKIVSMIRNHPAKVSITAEQRLRVILPFQGMADPARAAMQIMENIKQ